MTKKDFIRIQREAKQTVAQLAKLFPEAFDKNKPIVATLSFPKVKQ